MGHWWTPRGRWLFGTTACWLGKRFAIDKSVIDNFVD